MSEPVQTIDDTYTAKPAAISTGTKKAQIMVMPQRPDGASIVERAEATSWQAHTARGAISRAFRKMLGRPVVPEKVDGNGLCHRLPPR